MGLSEGARGVVVGLGSFEYLRGSVLVMRWKLIV